MNNKEKFFDVVFMIFTSLIVASFCYGLTSFILWEADAAKWDKSYRFLNTVFVAVFAFKALSEIKNSR